MRLGSKMASNTISDRTEPPENREWTPADVWKNCAHCLACERVLTIYEGFERDGFWVDRIADMLGCDDCDMWDEWGI